jgi:nicotinamide-nucleotide amidase
MMSLRLSGKARFVNSPLIISREIFTTYMTSQRNMAIEAEVGQLLLKKGWHIAVAETSTGGFIGFLLTSVPGSSAYFDRSIVAYSNQAKEMSLAVSPEILQQHGAVSLVTALVMATNVQRISQTEVGLAVTGLTGPRIGRSAKPIGLTYIAIASPHATLWWAGVLPGERAEIQHQSALKALDMLRDTLASEPERTETMGLEAHS